MSLLGAASQGMAQPMSQMTNIAMQQSGADALTQKELDMREAIANRLAERTRKENLADSDTEYNRQLGLIGAQSAARMAEKDPLDKQIKLQQLKNEQDKGDKPVYPKIIKLKDDFDKEYLIDQNTGAIGRPVSATEGLPAKSHWFSPDEPAVPGTKAGIVWTASDGQELPGGLASLYSQIKQPENNQPKAGKAVPQDVTVAGKVIGQASTPEEAQALFAAYKNKSQPTKAEKKQTEWVPSARVGSDVTPYEDKLKALMARQPNRSASQAEINKWNAELVKLKTSQNTGLINRSM